MAANASTHSNLVTLHTHIHTLLIKLSLSMQLSSPTSPPSYSHQQNLDPSTPNRRHSPFNYTYKNNPNDPLEVLYTLSPPAFHYLPRSTLLPPQIVRKGFMETPENSPPLLKGTRMQIMVIPRGARTIVIHFLVYDPLRKKAHRPHSPPSPVRNINRNRNPSPPRTPNPKSSTGKLRKMDSNNRLSSPNSKARDQMTSLRSTSRLSNHSEPNVRSNLDGMEIEVVGKSTVARIGEERDGEEEGEREYVVMKRVVQLPRKVWCGRNCKDKFEQLFIRRS